MTNYGYYKKCFAFITIPEEYFDGAVERARVVLNKIKSTYKVEKNTVNEELALYRMAEEIYRDDMSKDVAQRSIGSVTIRYISPVPLEKRLLGIAFCYLRIYRGVGS